MTDINWALLTSVAVAQRNQFFDIAINNDSHLFRLLPRLPPSEAGKCSWHLQTSGSTARGFREGDSFKNPDAMGTNQLTLPIGYFHNVMRITGHARDRMMAMGETQIANYMAEQFQDASNSLIRTIEAALPLGDDTDSEFVGLGSAIEDGNIYAGLDRASATMHRSYVNDNGGTPRALTTTLINATRKGITQTNRGTVSLALSSPTQCDNLRALTADVHKLGGQVQVQPGQPMELSIGIGTMLSSGLRIYGVPVFEIPAYPTDRIDFLDLTQRKIGIEEHRPFTIEEMPPVGDDKLWKLTYGCQLVVKNARKLTGRLGDLS